MAKNTALVVFTAPMRCRDPDRFDITRKSGGPDGSIFAPSWELLRPALAARAGARQARADGLPEVADGLQALAWERYVPGYYAEMRRSYRQRRPAWDGLLARGRVVLVCYCPGPERCHRRLLAEILTKLGASHEGELAAGRRRSA